MNVTSIAESPLINSLCAKLYALDSLDEEEKKTQVAFLKQIQNNNYIAEMEKLLANPPRQKYTLYNKLRLLEMEYRGNNPFVASLTEQQKELLCDYDTPIENVFDMKYIGQGSFSLVYQVSLNGNFFAVKRIMSLSVYDFMMGKNLSHPNLMAIYMAFQKRFATYSLLEYIPGIVYGDAEWTTDQKVKIASDVLTVQNYLATKDRFHDDLKWNFRNVIITPAGVTKVIDLGGIILKPSGQPSNSFQSASL